MFYNSNKGSCKIYHDRPFECRVYPVLIHFDKKIFFRIDKKVCPRTKDISSHEINKSKELWLNQKLSLDWVKAYSGLDFIF